jgi:hypothetical protein
MTEEKRSSERLLHDKSSEDIKELIMKTPDPKDKAVLMILLTISDDLFRNTQLTVSLSDKFEKHVDAFVKHAEDEMKIINQGRGFLRGIIIALAFIQILTAYIFTQHMAEFGNMQESVKHMEKELEIHKEHHKMEERIRERIPTLPS